MTRAYNELYLDDAMQSLGEAFDVASELEGIGCETFAREFVASGRARWFAGGNPRYVAGMGGAELVWDVLESRGYRLEPPEDSVAYYRSPEYWCGWILALYQWTSCLSFERIFRAVPFSELMKLYGPLHEAGEDKAVAVLDHRIRAAALQRPSRLQTVRKSRGFTQRGLAEASGVNRRTIEEYERGDKDLSRSAFVTVLALARALGVQPEDLLN